MAKQALIDAINESIAPFVHPDDLKPSRLTLSLWSGRIRFPHGLRLNADAINKELAKSSPSASSDEGHGGGGIGDRIRRRGRGNSMAEGSHPPNYSSHHTSSSVAAGGGPTSAAAAEGTTPKAASSGGASGGMWSPFSFGTGWSRSEAATEQQSNSTRDRSPAVGQQPKATRRMSNGTAGASTLASDLVGGDGSLNAGGGRGKPVHNSGVSYTTPSSYIGEAWAVNFNLDSYRNAKTEEDHQKAPEGAQTSNTSSRSTNPFLAGLGLPSNVILISGYVRQVQIDIPWSSLATKPVVIKLSGVKLAVMPTSLSGQNDASGFAAASSYSNSTGSGGGLFRARGKDAVMRKLRTKEEQTIAVKRRQILMEKEIRKRQQDAFVRCLFEDRTASSGREDNETETSGRDSPAPSIASVGSRSTVTGSGSDILRAAAHTSAASTVFGTSSEKRRMSFVLGSEEDDEEGGYGMHSISTSSATSMYHRSSLNTSVSRSQSPFLKSPAESMRKMTKRQKMPNEVFRSRLRRKIMENLCLDVRGIHIQICKPNGADEEATAGAKKKANGFVLGIVLDSLQLYTTDEHGRKVRAQGRGGPVKRSTFLKPKTSGKGVDSTGGRPMGGTFLFKALRVSGLGVYLEEGKSRVEIDEETLFGGATFSSRDNGPDQGDMYGAGSQDSAHRRPSDSGDDISLASMETDGLNDEVLAGGYGRRYVVNPISFEAAYRQRNDELSTVLQSQTASTMTPVQRRQAEKGTGDDETEHLLFSQLPHLSIVLSEPQLRLASEVVDSFLPICGEQNSGRSMVLQPLYPEYRPACSITSLTASDWWKYAIRSVRRMKRPGSCLWRNFMLAFRKKRKYMSLFKRYVAHCDPRDQAFYEMVSSSSHRCTKYCSRSHKCLNPADTEAMRAIEDDRFVSIEALLGWRAQAEAQLWRERRLETEAGEVKQLELGASMSRLQSVFQGGLGGFGGSASPSTGGEVEIQVDDMDTSGNQNAASLALTAEDLDRLELQLEACVDSPSRTPSSRVAELELSLGFVVVDLVSSDLSPVAKLRLGTLDLSCALFSNTQSVLSLTLSSVLLEDMTTFDPMIHTIMRSVHHAALMDDNRSCASGHSGVGTSGGSTTQPCSAAKFSLKRAATGDLEASLKMTTFEFLLSPTFSSSLNKFLDLTDNADNLLNAPGLYRYANKMFRAAIRQVKSRAKSLWDEKCQNGKRWYLDILLDPVVLIAPGNAMDADSRAVIFSLGQHHLKTTPKKEEKPMGSFAQMWFDEQNRSSKASLDSTVAPTTRSEENERSIVTDRWELIVSGITAAIGPSNDENWRHYVVDELIHAGAHSDGNMVAADVRPYLVLRPCVFQVDLGSSTSMEKKIIKHRRSWASVNAASPPLLIRLRSDDIVALGRSAHQMQEFLKKLPSSWGTDTAPTSGLGEPAVGNLYFQEDSNGPVGPDGILPRSIVPGEEQLEQLHWQEEPTHAFHFSYGIPCLKVALKLSREGSFITQLDSMCFGISSNSDKTTSGQFELADAWVFYQVEEAEPTVIFGDRPPNTKRTTSNCPNEGKKLVSAELSIAEAVAGSNTPLNFPFEEMDLTFRVQTRDVVINMHPKLLRLAIKSYRRIKQGLSFAFAPTADEPTLSHMSAGPGTSTFISFPLAANLVDDERSVGSNSSSDSSVSTAESLMESRPTRDFLGHFFPALSNAKRDLFRPTSALAVTASFSITSISLSIIPDNNENEEPSRFDIVFSGNIFGINTDDDGGKITSFEIAKVAITSASSYAYRQEYCKVLQGGDDKGAKFLILDHTKSPSSTVDTETGKIKPQTQTFVHIAPIHCVYLQSQVTALSDFLHKSGLRSVLAPALPIKKCLAFIDSNELTDIKLQELDIKIPESSTSTTKLAFRVGSTSIVHTIDPSNFAIKAIDLDDINLFCANNVTMGNPISVSAEITAARLDPEGTEEVDSKTIVHRIQISSSEVHLAITPRQYRQLIATLVNNIGSTSTKAIRDLTGSSSRPRAWRGDSSTSKNSSLRSLQSSVDGTGNGAAAGTAVAATENGMSKHVSAKIEFSIIIPAFSLSLCDESNGPFAKISAERAATLLDYGTEASPDISSSLVFGLYSLEITDERPCVHQNDGRYLLRQLFGEGGIREAIGISSKENDDGSFRIRANVGAWQMNLIPDLLDEVQDFFRLPADQESLRNDISLMDMLQKVIPDVGGELEEPPPSTFQLKTSILKFACFEEPVPEEDTKLRPRRRRCVTIQFALESKGTVQTSKDTIHLFDSQTNVDAIEIYSAEGKALDEAVQIMNPMSLSFFASKSATAEDCDGVMPTLTAKVVVSEPIDMTVSTQDVLLLRNVYLGLQDFSQAAIETLSDSISFLNASATGFGKFDAIADIPQSTSDVPREIDVSSSASQLVDLIVMVPSSTLVLVNDNAELLPTPLFKFTIENIFLESQADIINEEASSSLLSTILPTLVQFRLSIQGQIFDSIACRWKMSSQCDADVSYHRQQEASLGEGDHSKRLEVELNPFEIVSSRGLFEKLALSSPFIWMIESETGHSETLTGTRVVTDGPYAIRNYTGFHFHFSLHEQEESYECKVGETKHFIFENTRGFGFGYSRVFGQDFEDGKSISVFEKQDASSSKVDPHLLSLSFEDIDAELGSCRAHKYGDGRIVFSEVISENGKMILVIRARVLFHNFTRYDLDVGMKLGGFHQSCCSCSGLVRQEKSSPEVIDQAAQTIALGIPQSDRAAFDEAAEKAKSRLALELRLNGSVTDPIIAEGSCFVGTIELPSVPALNEMTTKGSVSETKVIVFADERGEEEDNKSNGLCAHITFVSTIMDGHPSVEIYLHPKAILRNAFPTRLYFALSTSRGEKSIDSLQLEAGESVQLFTGSDKAYLRVQAEPLGSTSAVVGAVEVRTAWCADSSEKASDEQSDPDSPDRPMSHMLGTLMIHSDSGVVEGLLNESTWAGADSSSYLPPTRLTSLDPRHILVDHSNSFSVECSDHPGSLELPSFLLDGVLTTPLPQTDKDPRILLREGTSGRSVLLQARSVPYGRSSVEASPLPLAGNSSKFSGYYALKKDDGAVAGALQFHILNGFNVANDTPIDLSVAEVSADDHKFTLHPNSSANVSWSTAKDNGMSLSVHHNGAVCSITIAVNAIGEKKYELRGDTFFGRVSVRVMAGDKDARLRVRIHSLVVDDAKGVAPMPANGIESRAVASGCKFARIVWGSGITINRLRVPHLRILQNSGASQQLALFAIDNLDAEYCIDDSSSQRPGYGGLVERSCATVAVKGLTIDDLRSGHSISIMCNTTGETTDDLFRYRMDIQKPVQSDILELEVTTSFPTLSKRNPLEATFSTDFVEDLSKEWRHCSEQLCTKTYISQDRAQSRLRWKKFVVEPLHLSLAVKPGADKRAEVGSSSLVCYIPFAVLNMLGNGQDIAARVRLAEFALGDTSTNIGTLARILQIFYASEVKSCISAEFSEATQSDLLADLRQRREICQMYAPYSEAPKSEKKVLFSDNSNTFDKKLKSLGCKAATGGVSTARSDKIHSSSMKKSKLKSSKVPSQRKELESEADKARGWFGR